MSLTCGHWHWPVVTEHCPVVTEHWPMVTDTDPWSLNTVPWSLNTDPWSLTPTCGHWHRPVVTDTDLWSLKTELSRTIFSSSSMSSLGRSAVMKAFTVTEMSSGSWVSDRAVCTTWDSWHIVTYWQQSHVLWQQSHVPWNNCYLAVYTHAHSVVYFLLVTGKENKSSI